MYELISAFTMFHKHSTTFAVKMWITQLAMTVLPCNLYLRHRNWKNLLYHAPLSKNRNWSWPSWSRNRMLYCICRTIALVLYYNYFLIILRNEPEQQTKHPQAVNGPQNSNRAGGEFDWEWRGRWQSVGRQSGEPAIRPAAVAEIYNYTVIMNRRK